VKQVTAHHQHGGDPAQQQPGTQQQFAVDDPGGAGAADDPSGPPSPVIATICPCARRASQMRSLASGEARAKTISSGPASTASRSASLSRSRSSPAKIRPPGWPMPTWWAMAAAVGP
jgi:hypothetical protein